MTILSKSGSSTPASRYGEITSRELERRRVGGDFRYEITIEADSKDHSDAIIRNFNKSWRQSLIKYDEWGVQPMEIVEMTLQYGYDQRTWSLVDGSFANSIIITWTDDSDTVHIVKKVNQSSIDVRGEYQFVVTDSYATDAAAEVEAQRLVDEMSQELDYSSGSGDNYVDRAIISIVGMGFLPLLARLKSNNNFTYTFRIENEVEDDYDDYGGVRRVDGILEIIVEDEAGIASSSIASNDEILADDKQVSGSNVWDRIDNLCNRLNNGVRYACRITGNALDGYGRFLYYTVNSTDVEYSLYKDRVVRSGTPKSQPRHWNFGVYQDTTSGSIVYRDVVTISKDSTVPRFNSPKREDTIRRIQ